MDANRMTDSELLNELMNHPKYSDYLNWKSQNRHVYDLFKTLALELVTKNRKFGIRLISNKIRWDYYFEYGTRFKISNNLTSLITRDLMLENPEIKRFCSLRPVSTRGRVTGA